MHDGGPAMRDGRRGAAGPGYDVVVIGSGFGGSVAALRLTEKGYRVAVVEAGRRFADDEFPETSFDLRNYLFAPHLGCLGIQRIDMLANCLILSGAGVGGGSLVYGNTLYRPPRAFFEDPAWASITDWRAELTPYFALASRMLGVTTNPMRTPSDDVMEQAATAMGVGNTFRPTDVGVLFAGPGQAEGQPVPDPYFGGKGPERTTCTGCGGCMTGCRVGAKNTLVKNYLHLAEAAGCEIFPLTTVRRVRPDGAGYRVDVESTSRPGRDRASIRAGQVVFAASALGTQALLHRMKADGFLPHLSDRLGALSRTNSEAILGVMAPDRTVDYSRGPAITSSFHPDPHTHVEPVRYGKGSNAMNLLQTVMAEAEPGIPLWRSWLRELWRERRTLTDRWDMRHWSERTVIALVMQTHSNSITVHPRRARLTGRLTLTSRQGEGEPNPTYLPIGHQVVRQMQHVMKGMAGASLGEPFDRPLTAHFLGGATIGATPADGVVDGWQRVFGHPGLHVADGSAVTANLGVNPSLTITAQAERAMAFWPNKGEPDPRPALGEAYRRLEPIGARAPVLR